MKTVFSTVIVSALLFSGAALADEAGPIELSSQQMDKITAGVGANNVAIAPWPALTGAGFTLNHLPAADNGALNPNNDNLGGVAVPSAVPGSIPII